MLKPKYIEEWMFSFGGVRFVVDTWEVRMALATQYPLDGSRVNLSMHQTYVSFV